MKSYDRLPKETTKAYRAFTQYRDQGPDRSLEKVASELSLTLSLIKKWSSQHDWVSRVRDYDRHLELLQQQVTRSEMEAFARRKLNLQLKIWEKLHEKVTEMMAWPIKHTKQIIPGTDGKPTEVILEPAKWNFSTIASLLNIWMELGQKLAGNDRDVLKALKVLVDQGWIPVSVLEEAAIGLDELGNRIRAAFADLSQPIAPTNSHSTRNEDEDFGY